MHKKDGSSVRPKSSLLEKAIRELEKMVAECKLHFLFLFLFFNSRMGTFCNLFNYSFNVKMLQC